MLPLIADGAIYSLVKSLSGTRLHRCPHKRLGAPIRFREAAFFHSWHGGIPRSNSTHRKPAPLRPEAACLSRAVRPLNMPFSGEAYSGYTCRKNAAQYARGAATTPQSSPDRQPTFEPELPLLRATYDISSGYAVQNCTLLEWFTKSELNTPGLSRSGTIQVIPAIREKTLGFVFAESARERPAVLQKRRFSHFNRCSNVPSAAGHFSPIFSTG